MYIGGQSVFEQRFYAGGSIVPFVLFICTFLFAEFGVHVFSVERLVLPSRITIKPRYQGWVRLYSAQRTLIMFVLGSFD